MNRTLAQLSISAAVVVLFGATAQLHAQNVIRGTIPMDFHVGSTMYAAGTYDLTLPVSRANPFTLSTLNGESKFALASSVIQHTDKTRARGPVIVLKCAYKGCFVTEIWTDEQGYAIPHPKAVDEQVASAPHIVALTRVTIH
jgi:hypothetical protein